MSVLVELPEDHYSVSAFEGFTPVADFSAGTGRAMIWLSQIAYETRDNAKVQRIADAWRLTRVEPFVGTARTFLPMSSTRGLIADRDGALIVAFMGTDPVVFANWLTNFNAAISPTDMHRGFEEAAGATWERIGAEIARAHGAGRPVLIAGHSLGGALAVATAERAMQEDKVRATSVYTYGMPRIGGLKFAQAYNRDLGPVTYRVVYGMDLVPTVPPTELGYSHVGRRLHCDRHGTFDAADLDAVPGTEEPQPPGQLLATLGRGLADFVRGPLSPTTRTDLLGTIYGFLPPALGDHLPDRYFTAFD